MQKTLGIYKKVCQFSKDAELLRGTSVSNGSLALKLAMEQNINDVCHWVSLDNYYTQSVSSRGIHQSMCLLKRFPLVQHISAVSPLLSPTQMKAELVNSSAQQLNCSRAHAAREVKQLCNSVLPYLKLDSIAQEAHRRAMSYTQLPEVAFTVNSTWKELETDYAQKLAQSVPQEIAVLIQAPYSM